LALACHEAETRSPASETQPPNILLIVADDLGFDDIGAYGSPRARTPRIDQLAASGTRFTRFYTAGDTCAPTRASLLTGLYPQRLGFDATPRSLPGEVVTLPELLGEAGYATHHVGKWHLGVEAVSTPSAHGFDTFFGFLHARRLTPWGNSYRNPHLISGEGEPLRRQGHLTDVLTASAVETIRAGVDGRPWFLNLWYYAPHEPVQPPDRWAKRYSDDPEGRYRALISALDEGIGRVLDALEETDQARRTIVVFLSDNGAKEAEHNLPFFGAKTRLFEGGVRVPMILRLPGRAAPPSVDQPVISMDLLPTFASLAGALPPAPIDGVDLGPLLDGAGGALPERLLFWESTPYALPAAVDLRALPVVSPGQLPSETAYSVLSPDGRWRLSNDLGPALFDLVEDPSGRENVWPQHPAIVTALTSAYRGWAREVRRVPVRALPVGGARWDGRQAELTGEGRVDLQGWDVLRTPGAGAWTFGVGVMPARSLTAPAVIAAQAGVWSLELEGQGRLVLQMGDTTLRLEASLSAGECTAVSVSTLHRFLANAPRPAGSLQLRIDGVLVAVGEATLAVPGPVLARATTLGNDAEGGRGFFGSLRNPTFWNVMRTSFSSPEASRSLCDGDVELAADRPVAP
jgi:arylsulfatase A-like enzyme